MAWLVQACKGLLTPSQPPSSTPKPLFPPSSRACSYWVCWLCVEALRGERDVEGGGVRASSSLELLRI